MAAAKRGFGKTRMPAKTALIIAVMWVLIGGSWLFLGLDSSPMTWKNWLNVGIGAFMILNSGYYGILFARQRRNQH
jgi:predicted permease